MPEPPGEGTPCAETGPPLACPPERTRHVDSGGLSLAVHEWGPERGQPVLLAHGGFDFGRSFDLFAPLLAQEGFRVVCWDQRGHGDSDHAALYGWSADVYDARVVLDSTSPAPVHALGHSKGGLVLLGLIQALPHRFLRFVNIDGMPFERPPGPLSPEEQARLLAEGMASWLDARARLGGETPPARSLEELARRRQTMNPRLSLDCLRYLVRAGAREDEHGWRWKLDPLLRTAAFGLLRPEWEPHRLRGLSVPLLALFGLVQEPMSWGASVEAIEPFLPPGAQLRALEAIGHFAHLEQPRRIADLVLEFLG